MEGPERYYAKGNQSVTEEQILNDSTYMKYLKESNSLEQRIEWWLPGDVGGGNRELFTMGIKVVLQEL